MKKLIQKIKNYSLILMACLIVGLFFSFVGINILSGCESWESDNCTSPKEIYNYVKSL